MHSTYKNYGFSIQPVIVTKIQEVSERVSHSQTCKNKPVYTSFLLYSLNKYFTWGTMNYRKLTIACIVVHLIRLSVWFRLNLKDVQLIFSVSLSGYHRNPVSPRWSTISFVVNVRNNAGVHIASKSTLSVLKLVSTIRHRPIWNGVSISWSFEMATYWREELFCWSILL